MSKSIPIPVFVSGNPVKLSSFLREKDYKPIIYTRDSSLAPTRKVVYILLSFYDLSVFIKAMSSISLRCRFVIFSSHKEIKSLNLESIKYIKLTSKDIESYEPGLNDLESYKSFSITNNVQGETRLGKIQSILDKVLKETYYGRRSKSKGVSGKRN